MMMKRKKIMITISYVGVFCLSIYSLKSTPHVCLILSLYEYKVPWHILKSKFDECVSWVELFLNDKFA